MTDARRFAPAALRNREPILHVLRQVLPGRGRVLEIASGSGEHAVFFAAAMPGLLWQPSDPDPDNLASIRAWTQALGIRTVCPPLDLDVTRRPWPVNEPVDAVLCINMIHIAPWSATLGLLDGAAALLAVGAPLVLYGPFMRGGVHTAESNSGFDASLRARDPAWGVRDLDVVTADAAARGFALDRVVEMPANNLTVVFRKD